jgi:hypothetical protein
VAGLHFGGPAGVVRNVGLVNRFHCVLSFKVKDQV